MTVDEMGTKDADKLYEIRQRVGMVFQNPDNQMVAANVEEEVAFGWRIWEWSRIQSWHV